MTFEVTEFDTVGRPEVDREGEAVAEVEPDVRGERDSEELVDGDLDDAGVVVDEDDTDPDPDTLTLDDVSGERDRKGLGELERDASGDEETEIDDVPDVVIVCVAHEEEEGD